MIPPEVGLVLEGYTATIMKGRKQKKKHDELEVRNEGFIYPAKNHLNKGSIWQTSKQANMHYVGGSPKLRLPR